MRRRIRIEELSLFIKGIRESVGAPSRDGDVVAGACVYDLPTQEVEAHASLGYQEGFIVHFMPVGWWSGIVLRVLGGGARWG